eukprot:1175106-Amorphochlora_amoeboformis.AAC.1
MSCSKAVKRLRGRDGWGAAARANVMDVESVLIVLHWLQVVRNINGLGVSKYFLGFWVGGGGWV